MSNDKNEIIVDSEKDGQVLAPFAKSTVEETEKIYGTIFAQIVSEHAKFKAKKLQEKLPENIQRVEESVKVVGVKGRLLGKIALVTGAASGIGRGIAYRFAMEGAKVSVVDLNIKNAKNVIKEIEDLGGEALAVECDVGDENQVFEAFRETEENLGRVSILVNNAGNSTLSPVSDMTLEQWRNMFRVHVEGAFNFSRAVIKSMQEGDRIINISSMTALSGDVLGAHYAAAKSAIIGLTKTLALEVAHRGITVNAIAPGIIYTPLSKMIDVVAPEFYKDIPVQRYGKPEDVAGIVAYLASSEASYITGQVIIVDGGLTLSNAINQHALKILRT
ncbi:MAG: SDR family NAD(P)-dependent oxidoreductase [Candidatus Freyarchaeum deiterrae]